MPGTQDHIQLTEHALACAGWKNPEQVVAYCCYPDEYFGPKQLEIKPYMFFQDGIQFHYPPDGTWVESYRYWDYAPDKGFFHPRPFKNPNFRMVDAGFRFYVNNCLAHPDKAGAFLGCLLHFLEDATFGIHALEGAGGADLYTLDRLSGKAVVKYLCQFKASAEFRDFKYTPAVLGADPEECVSLLYARYVKQSECSRQAFFKLALGFMSGNEVNDPKPFMEICYRSALALAADAACSIRALLEGNAREQIPRKRSLTEFAPFQIPVGGGGNFCFSSSKEEGGDIVFGSHYETALLYLLPPKSYSAFDCTLSGSKETDAEVELISDNQSATQCHLHGKEIKFLHFDFPGGVFGMRTRTSHPAGEIRIGNGFFTK